MRFTKRHYRAQVDARDCGVAALAMIYGYYGSYYSKPRKVPRNHRFLCYISHFKLVIWINRPRARLILIVVYINFLT